MSALSDLRAQLAARGLDVRGAPPRDPQGGAIYLWRQGAPGQPLTLEVRSRGVVGIRAALDEVLPAAGWVRTRTRYTSSWAVAEEWGRSS